MLDWCPGAQRLGLIGGILCDVVYPEVGKFHKHACLLSKGSGSPTTETWDNITPMSFPPGVFGASSERHDGAGQVGLDGGQAFGGWAPSSNWQDGPWPGAGSQDTGTNSAGLG